MKGLDIRRWHRWLAVAVLSTIVTAEAAAQNGRWLRPEDQPPIKPSYGLGDTEFTIGAYTANLPPSGLVVDMWPYLDTMGIDLWRYSQLSVEGTDSVVDSPARGDKRVILVLGDVFVAGFGREIQFYPFDSVQSPSWPCKFTSKTGGQTVKSTFEEQTDMSEQHYDSSNTTPGDTIAKWIAYGLTSQQVNRYKYDPVDSSEAGDLTVQDASKFIVEGGRLGAGDTNYYVVVTGHLFDDAASNALPDTARLLEIDVVYEIPKGQIYYTTLGDTATATTNLEILANRLVVRKSHLQPIGSPLVYDQYREAAFPVDLRVCAASGNQPGPRDGRNPSKRFDIRVRWSGLGKVALRSIAIRDRVGQRLIGTDPPGTDTSTVFRANLMDGLRRAIYGADTAAAVMRPAIVRIETDHEAGLTEYAAFEYINRLLKRTFNLGTAVGDSLPAHFVQTGGGARTNLPHLHAVTSSDEVTPEIGYLNALRDDVRLVPEAQTKDLEAFWDTTFYGIRFHKLPSIAEHNGGLYHLPELTLDSQGVARYEEMIQQLHFGRYIPEDIPEGSAWALRNPSLYSLGRSAVLARDLGRRMITIPGVIGMFSRRMVIDSVTVDTAHPNDPDTSVHVDRIITHIPEPSEVRLNANLSLCYGARGILYYWIGSYPHVMGTEEFFEGTRYWTGSVDSFGPTGERTTDRYINRMDYVMRNYPWQGRDSVDVFPDFYVGWQNNSTELQWLNTEWLPNVGGEMARRDIRWRDSYSINLQQRRPWANVDLSIDERPLPQNEIVTDVQSFAAGDSVGDVPYETFVELGLFYTHPDEGAHRLDTNFLYVVNRRTFERSADIDSTSARGRLMDTLAETRRIRLQLNLQRSTFEQYEFVRAREIEPDLTALPLSSTPRVPLDTIVPADAAVELTLRPGGGALLEITYMPPDTSFLRSRLEFNNGRRMIFDGVRYHLVFFRQDTVRNPGNLDSLTADNYIYYRRSFPVSETGSIQWEPIDTLPINFDGEANTRFDNRHPSITVHTTSTDTVVTIVWSAESHDPFNSDTNIREICLRNIRVNNFTRTRGPIEWVEDYYQHDMFHPEPTTAFGTPTVESSAGGYAVVWSDAIGGIRAKLRLRPSTPGWWGVSGSYSSAVDVSDTFQTAYGFAPGRYPTVPSIGHRASGDSSIAIAWQQPWGGNFSMIYYYRLRQFPSLPGPVPVLGGVPNNYRLNLSTAGGFNTFPSIDGTQDMWWRLQEVVAWESQKTLHDGLKDIFYQDKFLNLRSMYTDPSGRSWRWGEIMYRVAQKVGAFDRPIHASTASLNGLLVPADSLERLYFSVVYQSPDSGAGASMWQGKYWYTREFADDFPQRYLFAGADPNASSATGRQSDRQAVVYETPEQDAVVARTSREFFARQRPSGYRAEGRMIGLSLADTVNTDVEVWLYDPWIATDSTSLPLSLVERDTTYRFTNTLPMAGELLRTGNFHSHDSTQVGLEIYGRYNGSVAAADSGRIMVVAELIDSLDGSVVEQLDSFCISGSSTNYYRQLEPTYDLLSGTYYIRLRIDTANVPDSHLQSNSRYPVVEMRGDVTTEDMGKVRRVRETGGGAGYRISAQPNPLGTTTELRFSVPEGGYTRIRIYDALGRPVAEPLSRRWMEPGRFALEVDAGGLANGTYLVELLSDRERVVEKMVVAR